MPSLVNKTSSHLTSEALMAMTEEYNIVECDAV
jgi:hypothetical protein